MTVSYLTGNTTTVTPDQALFPYQRHTLNLDGNRIQYVDEGTGTPLLLIHPLPASSFIFRNFIPTLRNDFRCIAYDIPGFGYSTAAANFQQAPRDHAHLIGKLLTALDLQDTVIYLHDSMGAAALWATLEQRHRVSGLVISNTFAWRLDNYPETRRFIGKIASPIPGSLILRMMMPFFFRNARLGHADTWTEAEKRSYVEAFGREQRRNMQLLFRNMLKSTAFYTSLEQRLPELSHLPVYLPWGTEDGSIELGWLRRFEEVFPKHETLVIEGSHHFPQEYAPQQIADGMLRWWRGVKK